MDNFDLRKYIAENRREKNPVGMGQLYVQPSVQKEIKRQLDAYDAGDIDVNDLIQGIEDIIFGYVKAPTNEGHHEKDELEEAERAADRYNVNVFGYQTQYYKVCPAAKAFMDKVVAGDYGDMSNRKNEVIRMAKLNDLLFKMELRAVKDADYAKEIVTSGEVEYIADTIKDMADTLGIPVKDVDYVDNHVKIIKDAAKEAMEEGSCGYTPDGKPRSKPTSPEGKLNEFIEDSGIEYYLDEIRRDLEELDVKEGNDYLKDLAKAILKLKR